MQTFSAWLEQELAKRKWSQRDLIRAAKKFGYSLSASQVSNIINNNRGPSPETCIAMAYALGLPREEVFRARGWLLKKPEEVVPARATPQAAKVIRWLTSLDPKVQDIAAKALEEQLNAMSKLAQYEAAPGI